MTWLDSKPVLSQLPRKGYQDNLAVQSLVAFADIKLTAIADQLQNFYKELDPTTANEKYLDYLAYLVGLSGNYWDSRWTPEIKRKLIAASHTYLWSSKGTLGVLKFVLDVHGISYDIWTDDTLQIPFRIGDNLANGNSFRFFIRLDKKYNRTSPGWIEAVRTAKNFAPAVVQHRICYKGFIIGASNVGDPVFRNTKPTLSRAVTYLVTEGNRLTTEGDRLVVTV